MLNIRSSFVERMTDHKGSSKGARRAYKIEVRKSLPRFSKRGI